jgi:16S rRNA (cytidine1402-2'-O)-methyltransferase
MTGKLYIVPTPIGNLKDITLRALEVLKSVDLVAAEDTRMTLKLLNHFDIKKSLISYHKYNETVKSDEIIEKLKEGKNIALVSDAGSPGISDPGSVIIVKCVEMGIDFEVLPGATALITALVYSGLESTSFIFKGFLPRENKDRVPVIEDIKNRTETIIIYEAPHRLVNTLEFLKDNLGNRKVALCRELTKIHEEIIRLSLDAAVDYYKENMPRGEYVLVIEGKSKLELENEKKSAWQDMSIEQHIEKYIKEGLSKKEAIKKVAKDRNMSKSEIYKFSIQL